MQTDGNSSREERKGRVRAYFDNLLDIRSDMMSYEDLNEMMEENTIIHGSNMWILIMAVFIASIGLNVNSTAVIIGAMLISPLMSGILTMGYSLATGNLPLMRKAFTRFGTQVVISLITSTVYFLITPLNVPTSEMIARTSPTLWDVLIALFGGIAGGIGNTREKKGNVIPGVAIATALMPPLCTTGYGIATLQPRFILGAFYLFSINTLFIMLSAALVTKLMRVPACEIRDARRSRHVRRLLTVIIVVTVVPSVGIGGYQVYQAVMEQNITEYLDSEFQFPDTQVVRSDGDILRRELSVSLVGATVPDEAIQRLEEALPDYGLEGYTLQVTQNRITESDDAEKVTIAIQEQTIQSLQTRLALQQEELDSLRSGADCGKLAADAPKIFTSLSACRCGIMTDGEGEYILLQAHAEVPLSEAEQQTVRNWLMTESGLDRAELELYN